MFQKFATLKNMSQNQIYDILAQNTLYSQVSYEDIIQLPKINFYNFVNICNFVDHYQLISDNIFIDNIRYEICNKNPLVLNNLPKISNNLRQKIYDPNNTQHIFCIKYLMKNPKKLNK